MTGGTEAEGFADGPAQLVLPADEFAAVKVLKTALEATAGARLAETHVLVRRDDLREVLRMACNCPEAMPVSPQEDAVLGRLSAAVGAGK